MDGRRTTIWITAGIGTLLLLYVVSAGPLVFVMAHLRGSPIGDALAEVVIVYLRPHLWVAYEAEWYFDYLTWYEQRAGLPSESWAEYRYVYDNLFR